MRSAGLTSSCIRVPFGLALALVAGTCFAQGSITLYGIVDAAIEWSNADANRAYYGADANAGSATRLNSIVPARVRGCTRAA